MRAGSGLCPPPLPHLRTLLPRFASVHSTSVLPYQLFRRITTHTPHQTHTQTWITWIIVFLADKKNSSGFRGSGHFLSHPGTETYCLFWPGSRETLTHPLPPPHAALGAGAHSSVPSHWEFHSPLHDPPALPPCSTASGLRAWYLPASSAPWAGSWPLSGSLGPEPAPTHTLRGVERAGTCRGGSGGVCIPGASLSR